MRFLLDEIDATWDYTIDKEGNYFYTFDINYRNNFYILKLKYIKINSKVDITIEDNNLKEEDVLIDDVSETIYLFLNKN